MNPDPLIKAHTVEWLVCVESYKTSRSSNIEGWELIGEFDDFCIYELNGQSIIGFRGTNNQFDVLNDVQLSLGQEFQKVGPATDLVKRYIADRGGSVMLTGHSLGGALAREVGKKLNLPFVTFNCAAPPIRPFGPDGGVHYHIVFDLISAWQAGTIRIDKGYRPNQSGMMYWASKIPIVGALAMFLFKSHSLKQMMEAHRLDNFSSSKPGVIISNGIENNLWKRWFRGLPGKVRFAFLVFTRIRELPEIS